MRWWPRRVPDRPVADLHLVAVDVETTGLDPSRHELVSIGLVPVRGTAIDLGGAAQYAVRPDSPAGVGQSATVHGITDDQAARAQPLGEVLPELLSALQGGLLLAHHASIEVGFLARACRSLGLAPPDLTVVDTVRLQRRVLRRGHSLGHVADEELTLERARRHHGLPRYHSHDALSDALACAELYLAQVAALGGDLTLRHLVR